MGKLYTKFDVRSTPSNANSWVSHSNPLVSDDPDDANAPEPKAQKAARKLPLSVIRRINMDPETGCKTWCDFCGHWFVPAYCKPVIVKFVEYFVCADCRRERNLR